MKKRLVKNNKKEISLKSFYNKTKEFADTAILNYNLDNPNYVGLNLIEKDFKQKEDHMTLNKLVSMLIELNTKIDNIDNKVNNLDSKVSNLENKVNNLENKVNNGFQELNNRMDKLEEDISLIKKCSTIQKNFYWLNKLNKFLEITLFS